MELTSRHSPGTENFEVAVRFLGNLCIPVPENKIILSAVTLFTQILDDFFFFLICHLKNRCFAL